MNFYRYSFLFLLLINATGYSQNPDIPGWPCTGLSSNNEQYIRTTLTLKVLLVEFQDIKHQHNEYNQKPAYSVENFENLFFSEGIYVSPNMYSPDGKQVFGSLHDYYKIMSNNNLQIDGYIANYRQIGNFLYPEWIVLDHEKSYYQDLDQSVIITEAIEKATALGISVGPEHLGTNTKLAIVYAGHIYRLQSDGISEPCGLTPTAFIFSNFYLMGEQFAEGIPYHIEHEDRTFSQIGIHAHELGHLLGMDDTYEPYSKNGKWDLMAAGNYNGPNNEAACPAPINPYFREKKGWLDYNEILTNQTVQMNYNLGNPQIFRIINFNSISYSNYFLFELRKMNTIMQIGNTSCPDYNSFIVDSDNDRGIICWRRQYPEYRSSIIIHADGQNWSNNSASIGDLFSGISGIKVLSPWSDYREYGWVPNTKPSTTVGMEIIEEQNDYFIVDLFTSNPENASPSKPANLEIEGSSGNPELTWHPNQEPDFSYYLVDRNDGFWEYGIAQVFTNSYIDYDVAVHPVFEDNISYKIRAVDSQGKISVSSDIAQIDNSVLHKNMNKISTDLKVAYPNPFNPVTNISFSIAEDSHVQLKVYNILGYEVSELLNDKLHKGIHRIVFNGSDLPSGVYFYSLVTKNFTETRKMALIK